MSGVSNGPLAARHLEIARRALDSLGGVARGSSTVGRDDVLVLVQTTLDELVQVRRLLALGDAGPARVPCGSCGGMIMPAASLCLFCWRARRPEPAPTDSVVPIVTSGTV